MTITIKCLQIHHHMYTQLCPTLCDSMNCSLPGSSVCRIFQASLYESHERHYDPHFIDNAAAAAKLLQSCPTLCDPTDDSPPGSSVPGILQARTLEWVAISFSNACMHAKLLQSCPTLWDLWTAAHQAPLSTGFSRQEYWSGLPFPSPINKEGDINDKCAKELKPIKTVSYKNFILIILCSGKNLNHLDVQYCLFATLYTCRIGVFHYIPAFVNLNG